VRADLERRLTEVDAELVQLRKAVQASRDEVKKVRTKTMDAGTKGQGLSAKEMFKKMFDETWLDQVPAVQAVQAALLAAEKSLNEKAAERAQLSVALAKLPNPLPPTIADWKKLTSEKREKMLEEALDDLDGARAGRTEVDGKVFTVIELESWSDVVFDPFGKKILGAFKNEADEMPDTNEGQIRVGKPHGSVQVVRLADGTPIGGIVRMMQSGATHEERSGEYHEDLPTWEAATKAGFEDNDVSWTLKLKFNEKGEPLADQETYWDWSGH